jgi:uncharacterized protein (TIGR00730 family)
MKRSEGRPANPELRRRIEELIHSQGGGFNPEIVADVIENALKLLTDVEHRGDARVIQTTLRELRHAFRVFAPYSERRKITLFGSARTRPDSAEYRLAAETGRRAAEAGFMVITGAGPGIMQAGHEGAGPEMSFGANIRLPWEQGANPVIDKNSKLVTFKYFFTRKLTFLRHSDAIILFPGGFGTLDEGFEALTLMQTGKSRLMPLVLLEKPGGTYWKMWQAQVRDHLLRSELISPEDMNLYQIAESAEQAIRLVQRFYRNYHSIRYVRDLTVMRLRNTPTESSLTALNEDFQDILTGEPARVSQPTPEEVEDGDHLKLPRISFGFNRRNYGRLRMLIDTINGL